MNEQAFYRLFVIPGLQRVQIDPARQFTLKPFGYELLNSDSIYKSENSLSKGCVK